MPPAGWGPVGVDPDGDAAEAERNGMGDPSDRQSTGAVGQDVRRDRDTEPPTHRPEPIKVMGFIERHRRIVADPGRAGRCRTD